VVLKYAPPSTAGVLFLALGFIQSFAGWMFYPGQVAHLVRIETHASVIALSLNASAMYAGFAAGSALGGVVLAAWSSSDLGWVGGCAVAAALAIILTGRLRRPKLPQIAG
jgi:predicted MFS family arabinose efflux permease